MTTLKNKKGVSLVELIAVIVIMGIIATVGGISVATIITNSNKSAAVATVSDVHSAAKNYFQAGEDKKTGATPGSVTLDALVTAGYLEQATANKLTGVTITYNASTNTVEITPTSGTANTKIPSGDYKITYNSTKGVWEVDETE